MAEKQAWAIAESQDQWTLVAINPSLVMGPGVSHNITSQSRNIVQQMGNGTMKMGVPDWGFGVVDVRDVAHAHMAGAYHPHAKGRYIVSSHNSSLLDMAKQLLPRFGDKYPIPQRIIPKYLIWLIGPMLMPGATRRFISRNIGYPWRGDNRKSIKELGMTYRPLSESMNDFFQQLVDSGQV